jgi:hypothetical protein
LNSIGMTLGGVTFFSPHHRECNLQMESIRAIYANKESQDREEQSSRIIWVLRGPRPSSNSQLSILWANKFLLLSELVWGGFCHLQLRVVVNIGESKLITCIKSLKNIHSFDLVIFFLFFGNNLKC